jgi:hypothetical protein
LHIVNPAHHHEPIGSALAHRNASDSPSDRLILTLLMVIRVALIRIGEIGSRIHISCHTYQNELSRSYDGFHPIRISELRYSLVIRPESPCNFDRFSFGQLLPLPLNEAGFAENPPPWIGLERDRILLAARHITKRNQSIVVQRVASANCRKRRRRR